MRNNVQTGAVLPLIAPYAVASGGVFKVGAIVAVAQNAAASGAAVEGVREGVFTVPKVSAQAWGVGDRLYWDDTAKLVTTVASGNTLVGAAVAAAANPSATGTVYLDGAVR